MPKSPDYKFYWCCLGNTYNKKYENRVAAGQLFIMYQCLNFNGINTAAMLLLAIVFLIFMAKGYYSFIYL
jgi:hypothetical protein